MSEQTGLISDEFIDGVYKDLEEAEESSAEALLNRFNEEQPFLCDFLFNQFEEELSPEGAQACYMIGFSAWNCMQAFYDEPIKLISDKFIQEKVDYCSDLLDKAAAAEEKGETFDLTPVQTNIWNELEDQVISLEEEGISITEDEEAAMIFALRVALECLTEITKVTIN